MEFLKSTAVVLLIVAIATVLIFGISIVAERISDRRGGEDEVTYYPSDKIDAVNNNLKTINETLHSMQEKQNKKELEESIEEGYRLKLKVADGHTAFGGTYYAVVEHLIEADNFQNDGDWITLYKDEKKVATHPTGQVQFITKI